MTIQWESAVRNVSRLAALERSALATIDRDDAFDRLLELAVAVTGAPRGVITFVNSHSTTAISGVGFPEGLELRAPIEHSFCRFIVATGQPFMVEDAHHDVRTVGDPAIDAFAAVSWIGYAVEDPDGFILGTFCLMDAKPREWSALDIQTVATLAQAASAELALRMARSELSLLYRDARRPPSETLGPVSTN
jgi:GAF domain-containing protein